MRRYLVLLLLVVIAGCNLQTVPPGTGTPNPLTPTSVIPPTTSYVAPTPYIAPTLVTPMPPGQTSGALGVGVATAVPGVQIFSAQGVVVTATPGNLLTPVPAQQLINNPQPSTTSQNAIEAIINNLIVPVWNFLYTFVLNGLTTLWLFAGARGGGFAQVFCCVLPAIIVVIVVLLRMRVFRWRWR